MRFQKHLEIILQEMCNRVGVKFKDINFKENNWYMKYEWTEEEQDNFKSWLTDYFYTNNETRKELLSLNKKTKKHCKECAAFFVFNYGWKMKNNNEKI